MESKWFLASDILFFLQLTSGLLFFLLFLLNRCPLILKVESERDFGSNEILSRGGEEEQSSCFGLFIENIRVQMIKNNDFSIEMVHRRSFVQSDF